MRSLFSHMSNNIISIGVPRAERTDKPIFIGENPFKGTFRRNGEGDYHCGEEEINAKYSVKAVKTQDMLDFDRTVLTLPISKKITNYVQFNVCTPKELLKPIDVPRPLLYLRLTESGYQYNH